VRRALPAALVVGLAGAAAADDPARLAVADLDFQDTSGEVRDQAAEHAARLQSFAAALRDGLSADPAVEIVALSCPATPCTPSEPGVRALAEEARSEGARYLLIGRVHKISTLIGSIQLAVIDLDADAATCDRSLSYRGDTDKAWARAAAFAVRDVGAHCIP
jgi:hypothetical protein